MVYRLFLIILSYTMGCNRMQFIVKSKNYLIRHFIYGTVEYEDCRILNQRTWCTNRRICPLKMKLMVYIRSTSVCLSASVPCILSLPALSARYIYRQIDSLSNPKKAIILLSAIDKIEKMIIVSLIATLLLLAHSAHAQVRAILTPISFSGSHCPQHISNTFMNSNATRLTTVFEQFAPYVGPGASISASRTNCTVTANVTFSEPGYRLYLGVSPGTINGYLKISNNVTVDVRATYSWSGLTTVRHCYPETHRRPNLSSESY